MRTRNNRPTKCALQLRRINVRANFPYLFVCRKSAARPTRPSLPLSLRVLLSKIASGSPTRRDGVYFPTTLRAKDARSIRQILSAPFSKPRWQLPRQSIIRRVRKFDVQFTQRGVQKLSSKSAGLPVESRRDIKFTLATRKRALSYRRIWNYRRIRCSICRLTCSATAHAVIYERNRGYFRCVLAITTRFHGKDRLRNRYEYDR